jgi:hypothetical protein
MLFNFRNKFFIHDAASFSINARISDTRQAVVLLLSLTGLGNRPSRTPFNHVDRDKGMMAGAFLLPMI